MASSASRLPLICIFGATATGKTKLSVQLARFLGGEIISADSMQVSKTVASLLFALNMLQAYRGLDIATNKATEEERQGVPHHFLDVLEPSQQLTMPEFRSESISLINEMHARGKVTISFTALHTQKSYVAHPTYHPPARITPPQAHCTYTDPHPRRRDALLRRGAHVQDSERPGKQLQGGAAAYDSLMLMLTLVWACVGSYHVNRR